MLKTNREQSEVMKDREVIWNYIHGGKGIVDLIAPSGNKHTYAFLRPKNPTTFPEDVIFVYAFHNDEKLFYIGMIEQNEFRCTKNSRFLPDTDIVKGAFYILKMSNIEGFAENSRMTLKHVGICGRCGRALTSEKALATGIGPKCMKKLENL